LNVFQWLRYGPWLAQVVVTRRCNLTCGYCTEYDRTSDPAPDDELALRLAKLAAVCLTGGEPTMHPRLPDLMAEMRRLGFKRRMLVALNRTVRACQERDAVAGWTLTGSNQADVGSISLRSGTW
jgi:MoaA/NifB/PqqE/SkfB family radical SAM enzyme